MKKALVIVDMQNAFFANDSLSNVQDALVMTSNRLISSARAMGCPVFALRTVHDPVRTTWTLNMLDDDEGYLFKGDSGAAYVSGLDSTGVVEIIKTRDSGFWKTNLLSQLRRRRVEAVVLCGVSTHTCIAATASDAYSANLRVELVADAIASHDPRFHDATFDLLQQEYRIKKTLASEVAWE